jgi:hypothetical protein
MEQLMLLGHRNGLKLGAGLPRASASATFFGNSISFLTFHVKADLTASVAFTLAEITSCDGKCG